MNLLQLYKASKQYGAKILFDQASFAINEGEHVGVIGPNGAGKTTLFKALVGQEELDSGEITKMQGLRVGYLEQESEWNLSEISETYLAQHCLTPIWDLKQIGYSLGLTQAHFEKPLSELSGGYRMRVKLLYLIGLEPDLMLLDEPTNFLDLESILALENFLQNYKKSFLLISHDRDFLRRTTEYTLEVEGGAITKFPGHIDDYFEQKAELQKVLEAQIANQESKRKKIQDFIDRFRAKATKARQAQSRMKQLDRMETLELKKIPARAHIHLPPPSPTGKEILLIEEATLGYSDKAVLKNVNLRIERHDHLGIVGFNGAGKSTLLKSIAQKTPLIAGKLKWGHQVSFSYFAQHLTDELYPEDTVLDALQRKAHKDNIAQDILNIAGSLLFSGDAIHKKIKVLSGGEKTRVALGQVLLQRNPFLLMDEPTNHLDFDTVNALAQALADFQGTVLTVSHDRNFIRQVSSKIIEIRDGKVELFPGHYDDYLWSLEKGSMKERFENPAMNSTTVFNQSKNNSAAFTDKKFNYKEETKRLNSEIKELERKILKSEEILFSMQKNVDDLNTALLSANGLDAQSKAIEAARLGKEIQSSESVLLEHLENLDKKQKQLLDLTQGSGKS